jgi:hypothetical protein
VQRVGQGGRESAFPDTDRRPKKADLLEIVNNKEQPHMSATKEFKPRILGFVCHW